MPGDTVSRETRHRKELIQHTLFEQLCAPRYAASATAAQKEKSTLNASMATSTIGMLNFSMKDVGMKYSRVRSHHRPTKSE
jgi:hypothetical protein